MLSSSRKVPLIGVVAAIGAIAIARPFYSFQGDRALCRDGSEVGASSSIDEAVVVALCVVAVAAFAISLARRRSWMARLGSCFAALLLLAALTAWLLSDGWFACKQ